MKALSSGATVPHLNMSDIRKLAMPDLPPLPTQRKIASILSAYDDLIENNLQRIKILEEMTQNLYREWFVKFRFPGHDNARFVDSTVGKIPQDWEVMRLDEAMRFSSGKRIKKNHRDGGPTPVYGANGVIGWTTKRATFPACAVLGKIGSCGALHRSFSPCWVTNNAFAVEPAAIHSGEALCALLNEIDLAPYIGGAANPYMPVNSFGQHEVAVPPGEAQAVFEQRVSPMADLRCSLARKNANLRRTRDLLLPRLISGELDVSGLDIATGEEGAWSSSVRCGWPARSCM